MSKEINYNEEKKEFEIKKFDLSGHIHLKNFLIILLCFGITFLFFLFCNPNSFLYVFNNNPDQNWYITMGEGMLAGKVPYKDLFEHKGPIVYFAYALVALFNNVYVGAFLFEMIFGVAFLYTAYKILRRYLSEKSSIILLFLVAFLTFTSYYTVLGYGSVEFYSLPFLNYMLLAFLEFIEDNKQFSLLRSLGIGFSISILFWIKYTMLILPIAIMIMWIVMCIKNKNIKQMFISIGLMLISFIIVTIPILIYYAINDALYDLFYVYFYVNLFIYSGNPVNIFTNIGLLLGLGNVNFIFMILAIVFYFKQFKKKGYFILTAFLFNILLLLAQDCHVNYFAILFPFSVLGCALLFKYLSKFKIKQITKKVLAIVMCILVFPIGWSISGVARELGKSEEDYAQFQVAEDIHELSKQYNTDSPTMFCYKMYDYGFYNVAKIVPTEKFWVLNLFKNGIFPELDNSLVESIESQSCDFVVVFSNVYEEEKEWLEQYYTVYDSYYSSYYRQNFTQIELDVKLLISNNLLN